MSQLEIEFQGHRWLDQTNKLSLKWQIPLLPRRHSDEVQWDGVGQASKQGERRTQRPYRTLNPERSCWISSLGPHPEGICLQ